MASTLRTPPRFVPTLTTVLDLPAEAAQAGAAEPASPPAAAPPPPVDLAEAVALPPAEQRSDAEIVRLE